MLSVFFPPINFLNDSEYKKRSKPLLFSIKEKVIFTVFVLLYKFLFACYKLQQQTTQGTFSLQLY